jgi:hypothetical protein
MPEKDTEHALKSMVVIFIALRLNVFTPTLCKFPVPIRNPTFHFAFKYFVRRLSFFRLTPISDPV